MDFLLEFAGNFTILPSSHCHYSWSLSINAQKWALVRTLSPPCESQQARHLHCSRPWCCCSPVARSDAVYNFYDKRALVNLVMQGSIQQVDNAGLRDTTMHYASSLKLFKAKCPSIRVHSGNLSCLWLGAVVLHRKYAVVISEEWHLSTCIDPFTATQLHELTTKNIFWALDSLWTSNRDCQFDTVHL